MFVAEGINFDVYTETAVHGFLIAANSSNWLYTHTTSSDCIVPF